MGEGKRFVPRLHRVWFVLLGALFIPMQLFAAELVIMKVILNEADKGEYFFVMTPEKDALFKRDDLAGMGIANLPAVNEIDFEGEPYLSLKSIMPRLSYKMDERASVIRLTAASDMFGDQRVDLSYKPAYKVEKLAETAGFLNYSLGTNMGDSFDIASLSMPWEVGISSGNMLGFSSFSYSRSPIDQTFARLMTSITIDDAADLVQYTLGDFSASSGQLGSGGTFGGLSIRKNFGMSPNLVTFPGLNMEAVLTTPSEVKLYIDDRLIQTEHLSPGKVEFQNLPTTAGGGEATLVIKDAFGRVESVSLPFFQSSRLLKPGLHEYGYHFGVRRMQLGKENFSYGTPAFLGFHRLGLTDRFTAGLRAEVDKRVANFGPMISWLLGGAGQLDARFAISRDDGLLGYGGGLSYSFSYNPFNLFLTVTRLSRQFANLGLSAASDKVRLSGAAGIGFNQKGIGSIGVNVALTDSYLGQDQRRATIFYSRQLSESTSLSLRASSSKTDRLVHEFFVGLNFHLGDYGSGGLDYTTRKGRTTQTVGLSNSPPRGPGFGYRINASRSTNAGQRNDTRGDGSLLYHGPYGKYSFDARTSTGQNSYHANLAGGMAWVDNAIHFSRPINDSFALAKVGGLEGVKVLYSNQEVGKTNSNGEILVPDLISYYDNRLSIEALDIAVNYEIGSTSKYVNTGNRSAGVVRFDVKKLQSFVGFLYVVDKGEKSPAEYWGLGLKIEEVPVEFIVGKAGEFYLENLLVGTYPARLFFKDKECHFDLEIPDSDEMMVDMGEIACEME